MFNDRDAEFISRFIANSLKGKAEVVSLLDLLNERIPISYVNYWVIKKDVLTSDYSCLKYSYQKSSIDMFRLSESKELCWGSAKSDIHCIACMKAIQNLMHSEVFCYEIHEHLESLQAIKVDLPEPVTGSRVIYSFQLSIEERKLESPDKLVLKCLLPVLFHTTRQLSGSVSRQGLLSRRETAVLEWIKQGKSTWDISQVLSIAERTVNFHVKNIYQKLGVVSRAQAVAVAIDLGVIRSSVLNEETVCID